MNISELSDVEIERAMLWLYPTVGRVWSDGYFYYCSSKGVLSYLTDYNLTMPLAVEHDVSLINERGTAWAGADICAGDGPAIYMENDFINKKPTTRHSRSVDHGCNGE